MYSHWERDFKYSMPPTVMQKYLNIEFPEPSN